MCSMYWNLTAAFTCPTCGAVNEDANLQTHFMGEGMSCLHHYVIGESVAELGGITVTLGPDGPDDLMGDCEECGAWFDFGAEIVDGRVLRVWAVPETAVPA